MKEVIAEVLQVEEKVDADIKQAHAKAAELKNAAEKDVSDKIAKAKQQARDIIQASLETAKKEAQILKDQKISQAKNQTDSLAGGNDRKIDALVDDICKVILTAEFQTEGR